MDLQAPSTVIDAAVSMRDLSKYKALRTQLASQYSQTKTLATTSTLNALEDALFFSTIIAYAQGMHVLSLASKEFNYDLKMDKIASIWRGGCIIRSTFLKDITNAYQQNQTLPHLLADQAIGKIVASALPGTRQVISSAIQSGIAMPAFTAAISYFDALTTERMPSNLIQAQRDFFGAHTYEKIGHEGVFHTQWQAK
jgi:6-phosphogluconate dehydrogenase